MATDNTAGYGVDRLSGRIVVVTGGANGIGRSYCMHLVAAGAKVVVADLDEVGAKALAGALNQKFGSARALGVGADVTSEESTRSLVSQTVAEFERVDVLVNNAGSYPHVPFDDIDLDSWRRVVTLNLESVFLCTKAVLPVMRAQGGGAIVNVITNLVFSGLPNMAHYIAAKSGVFGLTKSLARELGDDGITVNALAPGAIIPDAQLSRIGQQTVDEIVRYQALKRPQKSADLVGPMLFLCSTDAAFVTGQVLTVDGGLTMH